MSIELTNRKPSAIARKEKIVVKPYGIIVEDDPMLADIFSRVGLVAFVVSLRKRYARSAVVAVPEAV